MISFCGCMETEDPDQMALSISGFSRTMVKKVACLDCLFV